MFKRHPLPLYFFLAFVISWLILSFGVAVAIGFVAIEVDSNLLVLLASFGPLLATLIVTRGSEGGPGVRRIFYNLFNKPIKARWWAAAVLLLAGLFGVSAILGLVIGGADAALGVGTNLIGLALFLLVTALGEEVGWRGFALPHLQQARNPLPATLILALFWWLWHLPFYWVFPPAIEGAKQIGFVAAFGGIQLVVCLSLGLLCAWVYNGSGGAILPPVLLHASWNFWLFGFSGQTVSIFALPLFVVAALVVGLASKGRLGYPAESQAEQQIIEPQRKLELRT